MRLSYKYRLYLNQTQREAFDCIFSACRFLYNCALEERITAYKQLGANISWGKQCAELKGMVVQFPEFKQVYAQTRHQVLKQLDVAYKNFFRRVKQDINKPGFPRFKNKHRFRSICFPQVSSDLSKSGGIKLLPNNKLQVFGIPGELKLELHRPWKGICKQVRIVREPGDRYYLVLSCDEVPLAPLPKTNKTIGIDLGLNSFLVADDETTFHHPKPYKTSLEKLQYRQRKLAAKLKANGNKITRNVDRLRNDIAKTHQKIANVRKDFQHKTTNKLIKEYDTICVEKLNVRGMLENKSEGLVPLNRNITDAAWGQFVFLLSYKAERAGKEVIAVDPKNTSKTCSRCLNIKEHLTLADRTYNCEACGLAIDRDLNAAINIHRLGTSLATSKTLVSETQL